MHNTITNIASNAGIDLASSSVTSNLTLRGVTSNPESSSVKDLSSISFTNLTSSSLASSTVKDLASISAIDLSSNSVTSSLVTTNLVASSSNTDETAYEKNTALFWVCVVVYLCIALVSATGNGLVGDS